MTEPFLGEIKCFAFDFVPQGYAACDGRMMPVNQNQALFSLLKTNYGGDGHSLFALPDLRGRTPIGAGTDSEQNTYKIGDSGGSESHQLTLEEMPRHTHEFRVSSKPGKAITANNAVMAGIGRIGPSTVQPELYAAGSGNAVMSEKSVGFVGNDQPHNNCQPSWVVGFAIAITGIYPERG